MNTDKLILMIDNACKEIDGISNTSKYFSSDSEPIVTTKKVLSLLKREVINDPERINIRVLRAMHDVGMSSYKDFEHTTVEQAINNVTELLYSEIPSYKTLEPLRMDFGKGDPI
jgi:hypothetical protein